MSGPRRVIRAKCRSAGWTKHLLSCELWSNLLSSVCSRTSTLEVILILTEAVLEQVSCSFSRKTLTSTFHTVSLEMWGLVTQSKQELSIICSLVNYQDVNPQLQRRTAKKFSIAIWVRKNVSPAVWSLVRFALDCNRLTYVCMWCVHAKIIVHFCSSSVTWDSQIGPR